MHLSGALTDRAEQRLHHLVERLRSIDFHIAFAKKRRAEPPKAGYHNLLDRRGIEIAITPASSAQLLLLRPLQKHPAIKENADLIAGEEGKSLHQHQRGGVHPQGYVFGPRGIWGIRTGLPGFQLLEASFQPVGYQRYLDLPVGKACALPAGRFRKNGPAVHEKKKDVF